MSKKRDNATNGGLPEDRIVTPKDTFWNMMRGLALALAVAFSLTTLILVMRDYTERAAIKQQQAILDALPFENFMIYYRVFPVSPRAKHGAEAFFKSDFEVIRVPKNGLHVTWRERIACDRNPYNGENIYTPYQQAVTTSATYMKPRPRLTDEELKEKDGYPVSSVGTDRPIMYPEVDSDCVLISVVTLKFGNGSVKTIKLQSDVVHVHLYAGGH